MPPSPSTSRPNLVLLCIDDLGANDLGFSGSAFYETPCIDRLAAEGTVFTNGYAASCMCSPSRASLLTGCTPPRVGVTNWIGASSAAGPLDSVGFADGLPEMRTLPAALRDAGYQTWHVGKWHLGSGASQPLRRGFDTCFGGSNVGGPVRYFPPYLTPGLPRGRSGQHLIDRTTDEAIALVRGRRRDRPFFLNLWHFGVHTPIQAPADLVAKYAEKRQTMGLGSSASGLEDIDHASTLGFGRFPEARLMRRSRQSDPVFAAMVELLDANVGRFLQALADEGLDDSTMVAFTSDNGGVSSASGLVPPGCNAPLRDGKGWTSEGGIRVPFAVRWPGRVRSGATVTDPVIGMDLMPTFLAAAGAPLEPDAHRDGIDLMDRLTAPPGPIGDGSDERQRDLFWHYPHYQNHGGRPAAVIRSGRWKLTRHFEGPTLELHDLDADPGEEHDAALRHPELVAELDARLERWLVDVDGKTPVPNPRWPRHGRIRRQVLTALGHALSAALVWRHERRTARRIRQGRVDAAADRSDPRPHTPT